MIAQTKRRLGLFNRQEQNRSTIPAVRRQAKSCSGADDALQTMDEYGGCLNWAPATYQMSGYDHRRMCRDDSRLTVRLNRS